MKLKLILAFIAISLVACSSDDDTAPVTPVVENDLKEIKTYRDGELVELRKFNNNLLQERFLYTNGQMYYQDYYLYNDSGLLETRNVIMNHEGQPEQTADLSITYDNFGRISSIITEFVYDGSNPFFEERFFDYSTNSKIIETGTFQGQTTSPSYYDLNSDGMVFKTTFGTLSNTYEAVFENGNKIQETMTFHNSPQDVTVLNNTYTFLSNEVKGEYINIKHNQFGSVKSNAAIYHSQTSEINVNYLETSGNEEESNTYQYEFNNEDYPVKVTRFRDEQLFSVTEITYQ